MAAKEQKKLPVASVESLLAVDDSHASDVQIPEWGLSVRIRGMTRGEARKIGTEDMTPEDAEVYALHTCLVEPQLTAEQARQLVNDKGFGTTELLLRRILEVSGLVDGFRP